MGWNFFDTTGNTKKVTLTGTLDLPIGTVVPFASNTVPVGWRLCDGTAVSRTLFSDLFTSLGTSFGVGDGSTTFNLPDFRGKVPVGKTTGGTFPTLGGTGGAETHTLSTGQLPAHTHSAGSLTTNVVGSTVISVAAYTPGGTSFFAHSGATFTGLVTSGLTGVEGLGQAHNNLQPYQVINYIIKAEHVVASNDPTVVAAPVPYVRVTNSVAQSIPTTTYTPITFNTEIWDTDNTHSTVTNTSRLTANTAGLYDIDANIYFDVNATGARAVILRVNGTTFIAFNQVQATATASYATLLSASTKYRLEVGDYVEVLAFQNSGVSLNSLSANAHSPILTMVKASS